MRKINGYTEEEARALVEFVKEGKRKGKTLTYLFEQYGVERGRAKGSVRNYYYTLMKNEKGDERVVRLLDGSSLSVGKIRAFTEEETNAALKSILAEKSKGLSVRRAIANIAKGDDKLSLRLQNKYRNTLKKEPWRLASIARELGLEEDAAQAESKREQKEEGQPNAFLRRKLENEINALYDRIAHALKEENARLRAENTRLRERLAAREP